MLRSVFEPSITTISLVGSLLYEHVRLQGRLVVLGETREYSLPTNRFGGKFLHSTMWQFKRSSTCASELFNELCDLIRLNGFIKCHIISWRRFLPTGLGENSVFRFTYQKME